MDRTHVVYRCLTAAGDLLYVGQTANLPQRSACHKTQSAWWPEVAAVIPTRLTTAAAARRYERLTIRHEKPRCNVHYGHAIVRKPGYMTPRQRLAEHLLCRPLATYIAEKRNARPRWPWRLIAEQLIIDTDGHVVVTHEAIRRWHLELTEKVAS